MMAEASFRQLWRGELPLNVAFWRYLINYGLILNLAATIAAIVAIASELHIAWAIILHLLPLPYSIVSAVGTWRSADLCAENSGFANAAKIVVVLWMAFWLFL
jgi:hypothetical protein